MTPRHALGLLALLCAGADFNDDALQHVDFSGRTCLALVGFSEARNQDDAGLAAVMQVVANRATDGAARWPQTLCDVALQPGQFLGVDRWPTPRNPERMDAIAWARALEMADQVIAGTAPVPAECRAATSFDQAVPAGHDVLCRLGAHTFYSDPARVAAR
jgi:spore germination cell wall hydrolase CwlJ-like protein